MSEQFLSEQNQCYKTLLNIVARGSAILAELQRLSHHIPKIFIKPDKKYGKVIYDFSYFGNMNEIDKEFRTQEMFQINQNIKNNYLPLLQRFYKLFQSIITYYEALKEFISEVQGGIFLQFSLENLLQIVQGKQLMCEAFYLFGVMLLLLDHLIQGPVRQRIIICYYRNKGGQNIPKIDKIRRLCIDSGFRIQKKRGSEYKRPDKYPEDYFARFPFQDQLLQSLILAIKDDDIYKQMSAYPKPNLRSFALANQSSMIFILLFFMPQVLHQAKSTMREIVDKHFYNCWVLPYYLGYIVDLTQWWKPYKAAKLALGNILDIESITQLVSDFAKKQVQYYRRCNQYLAQGVMNDQFVLQKINSLMNCLRQSNVTLRWLMLHRKTSQEKLKQVIHNASNPTDIMKLMLICAQFENILKSRCESLIAKKQQLWDEDQKACAERMKQLSIYFGGQQSLGKIQSDEGFKVWFGQMSQAISSLSYNNSTYAGRKIQHLVKALEDIEQYQQISASIQIKQYLFDTRKDLDHMMKVVNINRSTLTSIEIICDITWSWIAMQDYIRIMQKQIKKDPDIALYLKNTFMKLSTILNIPMVRLLQANSPDCDSVSKFYSNQLVKLVKAVLQIIPQSVFQTLGNVVQIFTNKLKNQPQKFDKAQLLNYIQFQQRVQIAKFTNQISVFAESILNMESYLIGVVQVDPHQILEDGIRKQLIRLLATILQKSIAVDCNTSDDFFIKITKLGARLKSFKLSLQYIQDFLHIYGLKVFYEQFQRLIYSYVDMEKVAMVQNRVGFQQLSYDEDLPLPTISNDKYVTFVGHILQEIIKLTGPKKCTFLLTSYGFFNFQNGKQALTLKTLNVLQQCIGVSGLQGLDHLLSFKLMQCLKKIIYQIEKFCQTSVKKVLEQCYRSLKNVSSFSQRFDQAVVALKKTFKTFSAMITSELIKIGQYSLLREMICLQLRLLAKVGSSRLYLILENINQSILNDMINKQQPTEQEISEKLQNENILLTLLNPFFSHVGMMEPNKKIYVTAKDIDHLPLILFTILAININSFDYDKHLKSLIRVNKKQIFEPNFFICGILCLLHQFHPSIKLSFIAYISSYIKSTVNFIMINKEVSKNPELVSDLFNYIRFLEETIKFSDQSYEKYKEIIDIGLFSSLDKETLKSGYKI